MKKQFRTTYTYIAASLFLVAVATSCQKEISGSGAGQNTAAATTATSSTIAVSTNGNGATTTTGGSITDSVYVMHTCERGQYRDSVTAANLPATIQAYLGTNYSGYGFAKAFAVKDTQGAVKGYVVIINFNGKPVGLQFNGDGTFAKVLEQRERGDIDGDGWHRGGRFEKRGLPHKDTISLSALPTVITTYMSINYAADTLVKAFQNADGGYLVLSKNSGIYATLFSSTGVFVSRVSLPAPGEKPVIADAVLPATALSYLATTYPNYVLDKSFSLTVAGTLKGYVAVIDANNTRYCVAFDASGNFAAVKTIW